MYKEIMKRNGMVPLFWRVEAEYSRSILVIHRITGEARVLDTK